MVEEYARVQVVLEVHAEPEARLGDAVKILLGIELLVLLAALSAAARAYPDALRGHASDLGERGQHLSTPATHGIQLNLRGRRVLLHIQPLLLRLERAIEVDRECVFRHV